MQDILQIDTTGLLCPLPVLRIIKRMRELSTGDRLVVLADDPASAIDIPHYCSESGHSLIHTSQSGSILKFEIQKS